MDRFSLKNLSNIEVREDYLIKISNMRAAFENSNLKKRHKNALEKY
jgi:uncharacterized protein YutD